MKGHVNFDICRIVIINVARIGDTVLATPLMRALKTTFPDSHITCIAHPKRIEVLENLNFIDTLIPLTKSSARFRGHGVKRWDIAFVLGHDTALLQFALRTSRRVIAFRQQDNALNNRMFRVVEPPSEPLHAVRERLLLANAIGVETDDFSLAYRCTDEESAGATQWLDRHALRNRSPLIGFQMGSFASKAYRDWPIAAFFALAKRLVHDFPEAYFILLGGNDMTPRAKHFREALPSHATTRACGTLSLRKSAALMSKLDLYVGVDTGPTHIAGALGVPMVALYHCFHPGSLLAPLQPGGPLVVIEHPLVGRDCQRTSPMDLIDPEEVWHAARQVIAARANDDPPTPV